MKKHIVVFFIAALTAGSFFLLPDRAKVKTVSGACGTEK